MHTMLMMGAKDKKNGVNAKEKQQILNKCTVMRRAEDL